MNWCPAHRPALKRPALPDDRTRATTSVTIIQRTGHRRRPRLHRRPGRRPASASGPGAPSEAALPSVDMKSGEAEPGRPAWMPTPDVLPAVVPGGRFLIRSHHIVVALSHVLVYPNGCLLEVQACARAGAQGLGAGHFGPFEDPFGPLVFAVDFGDQAAAVIDDERPWHATGQLVLMRYGTQVSA